MTIETRSTFANGKEPTPKNILSNSPDNNSDDLLRRESVLHSCISINAFHNTSKDFDEKTTVSNDLNLLSENNIKTTLSQSKNMVESHSILNINVDEALHCTTPYRHKLGYNLQSKSIFLCWPNLLSVKYLAATCSESSVEEIDGNFKENMLKRYIKNTVKGWDQKGLHYWLHKMDSSNIRLPSLEDITEDKESLFHLHLCEECISKTDFFNFAGYDVFRSPLNTESCSNVNTLPNNNSKCIRIKDNDRQDNCDDDKNKKGREVNQFSGTTDLNHNCSDQFFERFVYCYNTCGFNFELFGNKEKMTEKQLHFYGMNPFTKVVVYGTDPCGLNFPTDIYNEESIYDEDLFVDPINSTESLEKLPGSVMSETSNKTNQNKSQEVLMNNSTETDCTGTNSSCYEQFSENPSLLSLNHVAVKPLPQTDTSNDSVPTRLSSDTFGILYTTSTDESLETSGTNSLRLLNKLSLPLRSSSSLVIKLGTSFVNMRVETTKKPHKCISGNNMIVSNSRSSSKTLSAERTDHRKNYRLYSLPKKPLKVCGNNAIVPQSRLPIQSSVQRVKPKNKKRNNCPSHILRCSNESETKVRMIYLGRGYDRIHINEVGNNKITKGKYAVKTAPQKNPPQIKFSLVAMVCSTLLLLFFFNFLLVEDVIRHSPVSTIKAKWSLF